MRLLTNRTSHTPADRVDIPPPQASGQLRLRALRKRYVTELLAALLFVSAIAVFNSINHASSSRPPTTPAGSSQANTLEETSTPPAPQVSNPNLTPSLSVGTQEDNNMTNQNSVNTEVTVNGQSIPVPENGTTQQEVVTDSGNASVTITSNQSTDGSTSGRTRTSSHLHVSATTRSNDSVSESWSGTP